MTCCRTLLVAGSLACAVLAAGCDREPAAPASPPAQVPATVGSEEIVSVPAQEVPAESGLAIKRGIVEADGDHATFRACDDPVALWLLDEGDGVLTQLLTEGPTSLYVEAYGERGDVPENLAAAKGQSGVFIIEQLLYAAPTGESRGCERPLPDYLVAARGNEPFWAAEVTDSAMLWKQPDVPDGIALSDLETQDAEGAVGYAASAADHRLELQIEAQACRDSMSGEYFAFAARAVFDGREFTGCAHVGKQDAR